jgi:hypothetical protein
MPPPPHRTLPSLPLSPSPSPSRRDGVLARRWRRRFTAQGDGGPGLRPRRPW